jgi:ribose transport system substrate-binding protein
MALAVQESLSHFPLVPGKPPRRVGYVVNFSFHVWYRVVENYMRARAAQYGVEEVKVLDANLDLATEMWAVDELLRQKMGAIIVTPVAAPGVEAIVEKAKRAQVPLVLEANPIRGMTTMVAICDYDAGVKSGRWAGEFVKQTLGSEARVLDIAFPPLRPCLLRSEGFLAGLKAVVPKTTLVARVNGEARVDIAGKFTKEIFQKHPEVNVIFGMDDESTHGALEAVRDMGLDPSRILLFGFGLAGDADKDRLLKPGPWKASLAMFPEWVGVRCIDQAVRVYNGETVTAHDVVPTVPISQETLPRYFYRAGESWIPDFSTIASIRIEGHCSKI